MFHRNYSFIFCIALILISITGCSKISKGKGKTIWTKILCKSRTGIPTGGHRGEEGASSGKWREYFDKIYSKSGDFV